MGDLNIDAVRIVASSTWSDDPPKFARGDQWRFATGIHAEGARFGLQGAIGPDEGDLAFQMQGGPCLAGDAQILSSHSLELAEEARTELVGSSPAIEKTRLLEVLL